MYPDWVSPVAWGFLLIWLGVLSFLIWQQEKYLKSLFPKSGERDIRKKFTEIIGSVEKFKIKLTSLDNKVAEVNKQGFAHIQRVELLRFNPYNDTGGDQSFVVCLLDKQGSGLVVTSLHARSGTRVFGKEIEFGRGIKHQLSKEEEIVVKKAMERS